MTDTATILDPQRSPRRRTSSKSSPPRRERPRRGKSRSGPPMRLLSSSEFWLGAVNCSNSKATWLRFRRPAPDADEAMIALLDLRANPRLLRSGITAVDRQAPGFGEAAARRSCPTIRMSRGLSASARSISAHRPRRFFRAHVHGLHPRSAGARSAYRLRTVEHSRVPALQPA